MNKLLVTLVSVFTLIQVSGCSNISPYSQSEINTFGPAISKVRMIIPNDLDLKIDLTSSGWDNIEALTLNKMTAVKADTLVSHYCYSVSSPNDICESGVQYLEPLPEKRFNTSLSLKHYTNLRSNAYNEKTGKWYRTTGFTRVSWPLWYKYRVELIELADLATEFITLQKSIAYKLGVYKEFKQYGVRLEEGKEYTFADIKALLIKETNDTLITTKIKEQYTTSV